MKKSLLTFGCAVCAMILAVSSLQADEKKETPKKRARKPVTTVTCPIAGKEIKIADAKVVAYRDAKVYVCCAGCKSKMEKDATPFAAKANQQLVRTRQYRQAKCPISGGKLNKEQKTKVGGVMVRFCCEKCKEKAAATKGDDQLQLAFSDKAFEKAFVVVKKKGGAAAGAKAKGSQEEVKADAKG
ncbi:MAG: hypothetical protein NXI04_27240 [Planctomycetaceae bacterium]|nr:hypothetical protein [Planctomycetaceae bacterium]